MNDFNNFLKKHGVLLININLLLLSAFLWGLLPLTIKGFEVKYLLLGLIVVSFLANNSSKNNNSGALPPPRIDSRNLTNDNYYRKIVRGV